MGLRPDHGIVEYRTMMMFLAAWKTGTTPLTILTFSLFVASDVCGASALEKKTDLQPRIVRKRWRESAVHGVPKFARESSESLFSMRGGTIIYLEVESSVHAKISTVELWMWLATD
jgi:hypothetical protein